MTNNKQPRQERKTEDQSTAELEVQIMRPRIGRLIAEFQDDFDTPAIVQALYEMTMLYALIIPTKESEEVIKEASYNVEMEKKDCLEKLKWK